MTLSVQPILNVRSLPNQAEASSLRRAQASSKVNAVEPTAVPNVLDTANSASLQDGPVNFANPPAPRSFRDRVTEISGISSIYEAVFTAIYGADPLQLNEIA